MTKQTCGLCTDEKPCRWERCPNDVVPAWEYNELLAQNSLKTALLQEAVELLTNFRGYAVYSTDLTKMTRVDDWLAKASSKTPQVPDSDPKGSGT